MTTTFRGESRKGSGSIKKNGQFIEVTETYIYLVYSTIANEDRDVVRSTAGLPTVNITQLTNGAVCIGKSVTRSEINPREWEVTCEFSSAKNDQQQNPNNPSGDPTTWFPIWRADIETEDYVAVADANGVPYCNSAKQRFDEARMQKIGVAVSKFTQYEAANNTLRAIMDRNYTCNSTAVTSNANSLGTFNKGRLLLRVDSAELGYYASTLCWKVDYTAKYKKGIAPSAYKQFSGGAWGTPTEYSGWRDLRIDVGHYYISAGKRYPCTDESGNRILGLLDGVGGFVTSTTTNPTVLGFDEYEFIDFKTFIRGIS